jgi:hypothetical protein
LRCVLYGQLVFKIFPGFKRSFILNKNNTNLKLKQF